jgi:hypothetical protein
LEARDPMPREIVARVQPALKELLRAKLPGTRESDVRSVALGAYVAVHMYCAAEDRERLLQQLLPADLQIRDDLWTTAEDELRDMIEELPPEQRDAVWELLATTPA